MEEISPRNCHEIADKHIPGFGEIFTRYQLITKNSFPFIFIQSRACEFDDLYILDNACLLCSRLKYLNFQCFE